MKLNDTHVSWALEVMDTALPISCSDDEMYYKLELTALDIQIIKQALKAYGGNND